MHTLPDRLTLSNREFIERACQIAEAQATSGKSVPSVMVVGTHKDKLGINSEAKLKEINEELTKIHQKYESVLICKSINDSEVIFPINAMAPVGEERLQYTEKLQECILKAAKENGNIIDIPLKWLAFHLDLVKTGVKTGGIVHKSEYNKIGKILGMGERDVERALLYFNKVALIFYYPDDVPDLVLTTMDPLINRLSSLITASFNIPGCSVTKPYTTLRKEGLFDKTLLPTIFDNSEEFPNNKFLKLLECLKIVVRVGNDKYFLPSVLSLETSPDNSKFPMSCVPLVFSWDIKLLPDGFFNTLVVELLQQKQSDDNLHFELRGDIDQCRHDIQIIVAKREIPGVVKLGDRKRWVEVSYSSDLTHCFQLKNIIASAVKNVLKVFKHSGLGSSTIGFLCKLCDPNDHYCVLSKDQRNVSCSRNEIKDGPVTADMLCWIKRCG